MLCSPSAGSGCGDTACWRLLLGSCVGGNRARCGCVGCEDRSLLCQDAIVDDTDVGAGDARVVCRGEGVRGDRGTLRLSLIHISEPTRLGMISYAVFCLK